MRDANGHRQIRTLLLRGSDSSVAEWRHKLLWHIQHAEIQAVEPSKRKVLIVHNPFSGQGAAARNLEAA